MSDEKDQFPRFKKDDFGEGTGWLFAGGLVACAYKLMTAIQEYREAPHLSSSDRSTSSLETAILKMQDTINATMEAAYAPKSQR